VNGRSKAPARLVAVAALAIGFVVAVIAIGGALGGDSEESGSKRPAGQVTRKADDGKRKDVAAYVVQNGDTLTSIARETGVSVSRIQELNPDVDPQILISGEKLKLR
jgi:LysM repeat protein